MPTIRPKNILIAPLDWGLGHTTRCVPLVHYLLRQGHNPLFGGNDSQRSFISGIFGDRVRQVHLEGYNVTYSRWNRVARAGLLTQLPAIYRAIAREQRWLVANAGALKLDGVISDNRYGLFHKDLPAVIITHQPRILSGLGTVVDNGIRRLHYKYLDRFDATWIPDNEGIRNLGGKLSHPVKLPLHAKYIGPLSRFGNCDPATSGEVGDTLVIMLSGPEPQRTELSELLWVQAQCYHGNVVFIEGSATAEQPAFIPSNITYHKRLSDTQLAPVISAAKMIICRSGYSTIMDLAVRRKKAILIPTVGQTEQKYLAAYLQQMGIFYSTKQDGFNMSKALAEAEKFSYRLLVMNDDYRQFETVVATWLGSIPEQTH